MKVKERANWVCRWRLSKYREDIDVCKTPEDRKAFLRDAVPYEVREGEGNCLLETGIDRMWDLIVGDSALHFDNSNATIGVGDDDTVAAPAQTDLQAAENAGVHKLYKGMEAGFPTSTSQKVTFKSSFGDAEANFAWKEWVIKRGVCLNRKVDSLGTKASGTWTLEVDITLS